MSDTILQPAIERLRDKLGDNIEQDMKDIEARVLKYDLADAILEGSSVTDQRVGGWTGKNQACALSAAWLACKARGLV